MYVYICMCVGMCVGMCVCMCVGRYVSEMPLFLYSKEFLYFQHLPK